jgi:hypothetical protein
MSQRHQGDIKLPYTSVMGSTHDLAIRVGDAEREAAMSMLGEHLSRGRLDLAEFETRTGLVAAARTRGELEELFVDLPAPHPDLSGVAAVRATPKPVAAPKRPASPGRGLVNVIGALAFPAAIACTIAFGMWWLIPLAFVVTGSTRGRCR